MEGLPGHITSLGLVVLRRQDIYTTELCIYLLDAGTKVSTHQGQAGVLGGPVSALSMVGHWRHRSIYSLDTLLLGRYDRGSDSDYICDRRCLYIGGPYASSGDATVGAGC